jgi:hypothetical protein
MFDADEVSRATTGASAIRTGVRSMNRLLAICLAAALGALACASKDGAAREADMGGFAAGKAMAMSADAPAQSRVIIRTGSIEVVVAEPEVTAAKLSASVDRLGGYVSDSTTGEKSVHLAARVPSEKLESFLDEVAGQGEVRSRSISAQDVTETVADLQAEIDNLVALRDRLRVLLDKAANVKEVLQVEQELTRVQIRLDSLMSHKQRIDKDVALSAVNVSLTAAPEPRILGPFGLLYEGMKWFAIKLFVISP